MGNVGWYSGFLLLNVMELRVDGKGSCLSVGRVIVAGCHELSDVYERCQTVFSILC